jgi:oxaloacetate decarboxylase (Na+ extruding) subunit alpha
MIFFVKGRGANMINNRKPVKIVDTVLRDGHQSLAATRMRLSDMVPMLEQLDNIGYHALEVWGGATFDSCLRFLDENPWDRLRVLKMYLKKTPLMMLLRGQNVLGYNHYADDVVQEFVKRAVYNGIDIIRIFDALNDVRNLEVSMNAAKKEGAHVQGAVVYTISPLHNTDHYIKVAKSLRDLGADSLCIKDMAGLLAPYDAYQLVSELKKNINLPIELHTHYTSGMASMTYLKAIEAGVDIIDCALSPFALGTSQPATEAMVAALEGTPGDTGISKETLFPIADYFRGVKKNLEQAFGLNTAIDIDTKVLSFQIPGGMLSNMLNQLKEQGHADKYSLVLEEMPKVRAELGYPPLVTPTSQIVGSQAVANVIFGRYAMVSKQTKDLVRGKYGRTPGHITDEIRQMIIGDEKTIDYRPADDIQPQIEAYRQELLTKGYFTEAANIEDVLSYALFPDVAIAYFDKHR